MYKSLRVLRPAIIYSGFFIFNHLVQILGCGRELEAVIRFLDGIGEAADAFADFLLV